MAFAILTALLLPLQGYAAMPACQEQARTHISAAPSATPHDCSPATAPAHQHHCGQCCCAVGIAPAPGFFIAPHVHAAEMARTAIAAPPQGALDRLDRPPRFILT